ncbi:MAG: SPOR domain-containing protein [Deltaproteobacteria bacterium]|nr:SPOR domain-containing protein [Deltaproteobacteria bacterium]
MNNTNENKNLQFTFTQLLLFLLLQVAFLGGAFYLGTKFGNSSPAFGEKKAVQKDVELSNLLPQKNQENAVVPESVPAAKKLNTFEKSNTVVRIKSSANSEYTLQIASFPEESSAIQVVGEWKQKGYMAYLSVEDIHDRGKWYRVNIGNFGDEESATEFAKKIKEKENVSPQVVLTEQ